MFSISVETALRTALLNLFTSSKHPTAPHSTMPIRILERFCLSIAESQLKTIHGLPIFYANALTDSVLPVPAGPCGFDDFPTDSADINVEKHLSVSGVNMSFCGSPWYSNVYGIKLSSER